MKTHTTWNVAIIASLFIAVFIGAQPATAAVSFSQSVTLEVGWNIVSTPRIVESHTFSASETSDNFDIYILDASSASGWSTMAGLGQTEFTPLYGYFIQNKTGEDQILTFHYKAGTEPNERLFERTFSTPGWYSFGIANPTYAKDVNSDNTDTDNPRHILNSLRSAGTESTSGGDYDSVVDLTHTQTDPNSVSVSDTWKEAVHHEVNTLDDFRETKAYAIFINKENARYSGFQNNTVLQFQCSDGIDNDNDGLIDYPSDPGCLSTTDDDEGAGQVTVSQDTSIASQNIAVDTANQILGGISIDVQGEPASAAQIVFDVTTTVSIATTSSTSLIDVSLVDENGTVVAGPVDESGSKITFSDTVIFPVGVTKYQIKGKVPTGATNDMTYQLTTNPSSDWTTVVGENTGDAITPSPSGDQTYQTMTVKIAAVTISVSDSPAVQTVVAGVQGFTFANYQLDATASGEDVRFNNLPLEYNIFNSNVSDLTSCQLFDGSTALNTGSNTVDPSAAGSSTAFTFDTGFVVPKGTVKTLALKCNAATGITTSFSWGYATGASGTGITTGQSALLTENVSSGQKITFVLNGTLHVTLDSTSPSYAIAAANTTGNTLSILRVNADTEAIEVNRVALQITHGVPADLAKITLWDGSTQVGEAIFTGSNPHATSTLTTSVQIPKGGHKLLSIKGDFTEIGTGKPATQGHLVTVDYDGDDAAGTSGIGNDSGVTINQSSNSDTASNGARMFRSYPTFSKLAVPTNTLSNGTKTLARWRVDAASQGDVGLHKFTLLISTTTAKVTDIDIYCYTNSGFSSVCSGLSTDGGFLASDIDPGTDQIDIAAEDSSGTATTIQVPAGTSRYFEVRGTVSSSAAGASVSTQLEGDASYPDLTPALMGTAVAIKADTHNDFVWSPNGFSTSALGDSDWTNGYGVSGFPGTNMVAEVLSQ